MEKNCKMNKKEPISVLMVLAAAALWGGIGLFVRTLTKGGLTSAQMTATRLLTTAVILFFYLFVTDKKKLKISVKDLGWFAANGILSICFFNTCYTTCIQLSSMATAAVLLYTAPMFVMLLSAIIFKEKLTWKKIICLILAFGGCALVSGIADGKMTVTTAGLLAGLGAGIGYALYSIFSGILIKKYAPLTNIFYTFSIAGIVPFTTADMGSAFRIYSANMDILLINLLAGFLTCALPYVLYTSALKTLMPSRASLLASIEPVVAVVLGFFVFHEKLSLWGYVGIVLVLAAVFLSNFSDNV